MVMGRRSGSVFMSSTVPDTYTRMSRSSGTNVAAGSSRASFPCSTSIMMATLVIGLDME